MDQRWQLNEEDLGPEEPRNSERSEPTDGLLRGRDPGGVVTVCVTDIGEFRSVELASGWRSTTDPRSLSTHVVAAANDATMQAATVQAEAVQSAPPEAPAAPAGGISASDEPITAADAMQLINTVSADLEAFNQRMTDVVGATVSGQSGGGHVRGTARQGQILKLDVDATWCSAARNTEIEGELTDVLQALRDKTSPADLTNGPQSPAISQLYALASDPQRLLRRLGLVTEPTKGP
ncbi:YbaB/EbfC family nucleoid-associated protein [Saccharopolyspora gloriosae]|uniref:YbaB/EbfC family nucleoid-associated protein n=1 Tax=Saccharopolyspora gloriosae TaxID=455344 RepID=UPI001FB5E9A2|nr:YbaB/EbfC family nucleoid-associated protein [Saccharopolyspora gloriosae]